MEENNQLTDELKLVAILNSLSQTADSKEKKQEFEEAKQKILIKIDEDSKR